METKICIKCNKVKEVSLFRQYRKKCKSCSNKECNLRSYLKNPKKSYARHLSWRLKNPDKAAARDLSKTARFFFVKSGIINPPKELIEIKKLCILIKREIRNQTQPK